MPDSVDPKLVYTVKCPTCGSGVGVQCTRITDAADPPVPTAYYCFARLKKVLDGKGRKP